MISVTQGIAYRKREIIIFTGNETIPCPVCGGHLKVRGTCERKVIRREGTQTYRLRVMECGNCGKTHRELPSFIMPYKRMDADILSEAAEASGEENLENWTVENFVRREMKKGRTNSAQITRKHQEKCARENSMPHLRFFRIPLASERSGLFALWNFQAGKP